MDGDPARKPARPVCTVLANGRRIDLMNLTPKMLEAIDLHLHNLDFGYLTIRVAHSRPAGFDRMETHRVLDDLVGQSPPKRGAA